MDRFQAPEAFKLQSEGDDWLQKRQGLALPALPPTSSEARNYCFTQVWKYGANGRQTINFEAFARKRNQRADGKDRFCNMVEVLSGYANKQQRGSYSNKGTSSVIPQIYLLHQIKFFDLYC